MSSGESQQSNKGGSSTSSDELIEVVEELLNSLSTKFAGVSGELFAKMDDMSRRLDSLEATLQTNQDVVQANPAQPATTTPPSSQQQQ